MIISEAARSIRKQQQTERLAAKAAAAESGDWEGYSLYFSSQGLEVAKAEQNAKITQARQLVRKTKEAVEIAKITGVDIAAAMTAHATARVTLEAVKQQKQDLFGRSSAFSIGVE